MSEFFDYVLGMDCGTTNIKAVVLRSDGAVAAEASRPSRFLNPGRDMQEQDAEEWWHSAAEIFRSIAVQLGPEARARIRGICISSHTVSMLPVDAGGSPLRPAMTYQDGRSARELEEIVSSIGKDRFVRIVGGQPSVAFLPNKLLWYKRNELEKFDKTAYFLQASSYINFKLTGVMSSDIDQALRTQCMDIGTLDWSEEIARAIGVDLKEKMPPVRQVDEIIGCVTEQAAKETGLVPGIPVVAGCSDAMASMLATGMSRLGESGESSGTTSLLFVGSRVKSAPDAPVVTRPCSIPGMPWVFDAPIQSSGAALKWFIDKLAAEENAYAAENGRNVYDFLNELALQSVPGASGLFFFPYLLGERAPLWNDHASGMFIGLRMDMKRADLIRAVFEGTAYALRHAMETVKADGAEADMLRICGGGAKSRTWSMIKASMLRLPVYVLSEESGNVPVGDALIVGHKLGVFPDLKEATDKIVKVAEVIEPIPAWADTYDKLYPYYVDMYRHLDADLKNLQQTLRTI